MARGRLDPGYLRNREAITAAILTMEKPSGRNLIESTGLSRSTIDRHLQALKRSGELRRLFAVKYPRKSDSEIIRGTPSI